MSSVYSAELIAGVLSKNVMSDLKETLDNMAEEGEEIRERVARVADTAAIVYVLKIGGADTSLEEAALASSMQSLRAAGASIMVEEVKSAMLSRLSDIFRVAVAII